MGHATNARRVPGTPVAQGPQSSIKLCTRQCLPQGGAASCRTGTDPEWEGWQSVFLAFKFLSHRRNLTALILLYTAYTHTHRERERERDVFEKLHLLPGSLFKTLPSLGHFQIKAALDSLASCQIPALAWPSTSAVSRLKRPRHSPAGRAGVNGSGPQHSC